jgi:hypothetical protein
MENAIAIGLLIGVVCGAIALIYAFSRGRFGLGILAGIATTVAGIILGIFGAAPVCGIFIWLARKGPDMAKQNT